MAVMDRHHGLSLTELLVVIAAIAVLSGIMTPALWSARQQAQTVVCMANIKQVGTTLAVYEQANGTFPQGLDNSRSALMHGGWYAGDQNYDTLGRWWFEQLDGSAGDFHDKNSIFWCPSRKVADAGLSGIILGNYGINRAICMDVRGSVASAYVGKPLASEQIAHPAMTLLAADSGYCLISWQAAADNVLQRAEGHVGRDTETYVPGLSINTHRAFSMACRDDAIEGRHAGRTINVAYADGHVNSIAAESLLVEAVGDGWRNQSPLWLP
jgi:prepilin-type processing-associated H-X9-DG protein/prepilin-type N-terminal cleavage/methylation domain-containing protein